MESSLPQIAVAALLVAGAVFAWLAAGFGIGYVVDGIPRGRRRPLLGVGLIAAGLSVGYLVVIATPAVWAAVAGYG